MLKPIAYACLVLALTGEHSRVLAQGKQPGFKTSAFKRVTLKPALRLGYPSLRVEVGADKPLVISGRKEPIRFELKRGDLWIDAKGSEECETKIVAGRKVAVALDKPDAYGCKERYLTFRSPAQNTGLGWSVVVLDALKAKIGKKQILFLDHDADGKFTTKFADFVVYDSKIIQPVTSIMVLGEQAIEIEFKPLVSGFSWRLNTRFAVGFPKWKDMCKGLHYLNQVRADINLPPFGLDQQTSLDALAHARYCAIHGLQHNEEKGKAGYTEAGAAAGPNSLGSPFGGVIAGVQNLLSTLLHRLPLVDPRLCEIGIGADGNQVWIEWQSGEKREWAHQGPVIFPGAKRGWKFGTFRGEKPDPRPDKTQSVGVPITCSWYDETPISKLQATLFRGRREVAHWTHSDTKNQIPHSDMFPEVRLCILPKRPLRPGVYQFAFEWTAAEQVRKTAFELKIGR